MNSNKVYIEDEQESYTSLQKAITKERELIELMKSQLLNDPDSLIGYLQCKLEGLKSKSSSLSRFLIHKFRFSKSLNPSPNYKDAVSFSFEDSFTLNPFLDSINTHEPLPSDDYDIELHRITSRLSEKDNQILYLKQSMNSCIQEKDEIIRELEDEIIILKHSLEIHKHHLKTLKNGLKDLGDKLSKNEDLLERKAVEVNMLTEKIRDSESEIITLIRKLNEAEEVVKDYESALEDTEGSNSNESLSVGQARKIAKMKIKIKKLEDEKTSSKIIEEERYRCLVTMYEKGLNERDRLNDTIKELHIQMMLLEDKVIENENLALKAKIKLQEELMERISRLRVENHELRKRLQDFVSRDFDPPGLGVNSLRDEFKDDLESESEASNFVSVINFEDAMENQQQKMLKSKLDDCENQIRLLNYATEDYKRKIEVRDNEIIRLKGILRGSELPKNRPSIFTKVKANPVVLKLFALKRCKSQWATCKQIQ